MEGRPRAALVLLGSSLLLSSGGVGAQSSEPRGGGACAAQHDGGCLEGGTSGSPPAPAADHPQRRWGQPGAAAASLLQVRRSRYRGPAGISRPPSSALEAGAGRRYTLAESQVARVDHRGLPIIKKKLGDEARASNVARNLKWLKQQGVPFECWIFIYNLDPAFPASPARFEPCRLIRHAGFWMSHVLAVPLNLTAKPWVLHMMDAISPGPDVSLLRMQEIMKVNGLGHASPTFDVADPKCIVKGAGYPIMHRNRSYPVGRFADFIEMHMDLFSRAYFACLQDSIDTDNLLGWGMDALLAQLCGGAGPESPVPPLRDLGSMGLLDQMTMSAASAAFRESYSYSEAGEAWGEYLGRHQDVPQAFQVVLGPLRPGAPPEG